MKKGEHGRPALKEEKKSERLFSGGEKTRKAGSGKKGIAYFLKRKKRQTDKIKKRAKNVRANEEETRRRHLQQKGRNKAEGREA